MKHPETFPSAGRSTEQQLSYEEMQPRRAEFVFAPSIHTMENMGEIVDTLRDCNIVAVECRGGTLQERAQDEHDLNVLSSVDASPDTKAESMARLRAAEINVFLIQLAEGLDKKIVLIDIDDEHAAQEALNTSDEAKDDFLNAIDQYQPIAVLREKIITHTKADARASAMREHEMVRQLEDLGDENAQAKIGVILGAVHTPVQHEITKKFRMRRSFIDKGTTIPSPGKKRFTYGEELSRHYRMVAGREAAPLLVDRAMLETFFVGYQIEGIDAIRLQVIDHMSDEDVERALAEIGRVRERGFGTDDKVLDYLIDSEIKRLLVSCVDRFGEWQSS